MLNVYEPVAGRGSKSASLLGSVAVHVALVLILYQLRTVVPRSTHYAVTQLFLPAAVPPPAKAPAMRQPVITHVIATHLIAPHTNTILALPAPQPHADLPAPPELAVTRPALPAIRQSVPSPPAPAAPAPPPPAFPSALPAAASAPHTPTPRTGTFGAIPTAVAPVVAARLQLPAGGFGAVPADTPHASPPNTVAGPSAFGSAGVVATNPPRGPAVTASSSFGGVGTSGPAVVPPPAAKPASTAFGAAVAADPAKHAPPPPNAAAESLEILFKPRPDYTEEARRARIEGDVVLEVLFTASGNLRVIRIVRGLGYGLDRNAIDAASKIRFRPATENTRAVDTVALVRISFQIAY